MRRMIIWILACFALPIGCSYKPVRHLASDAALIKAGESTRKDVLRYLGEPDGRRALAQGMEEYLYSENQQSQFSGLPLVGKWIDPASQELVIVTLKDDQVTGCEFRLLQKDDLSWKKDTQWEPVK